MWIPACPWMYSKHWWTWLPRQLCKDYTSGLLRACKSTWGEMDSPGDTGNYHSASHLAQRVDNKHTTEKCYAVLQKAKSSVAISLVPEIYSFKRINMQKKAAISSINTLSIKAWESRGGRRGIEGWRVALLGRALWRMSFLTPGNYPEVQRSFLLPCLYKAGGGSELPGQAFFLIRSPPPSPIPRGSSWASCGRTIKTCKGNKKLDKLGCQCKNCKSKE